MHIELRQIRKHFGPVKANDGISLTFESGRIYGLLGENGAGKSTLMKILSGYQPPDSGEILVNGQPQRFASPADALGNGIGMLYQDPLDFPPFRISENYLLGRDKRFFLNLQGAQRELTGLSERYGFSLDLQSNIDNLSLGERQQLELVRLLVGGAQLLILDEPTTGISAEQKDVLFDSILKLAHEEGKTVILVSHKLDEVQELCGHAYVLLRGRLVGEASVPCLNETLVEMMFGQVPDRENRAPFPLGDTVLDAQDLTVTTPQLSVEHVNLQVCKGEVFGFAGLEGSGQRLVLQAVAGVLKPERGKILFDGQDIKSWGYHRRQSAGIAYVAAGRLEEGLVAGLTLAEHVVLAQPKHTFLVDFARARKETQARIEKFKIVGTPDTTADALSGGNQQRLLFALLNDPLKLILLEHPTRGLDIRSANWIWELLYRRRADGTAILFMSADLDEVIERSDRIAVFCGGKMSRIVDARQTSVDELGHMIGGQV